jgi:hypothetical protein
MKKLNKTVLLNDIKALANTIPTIYKELKALPPKSERKDKWHVDLLCECGGPIGIALVTIWQNGSLFVDDTSGATVHCGTCEATHYVDNLAQNTVHRHLESA